MPIFTYIAAPSGNQSYVTASNEVHAADVVGAGNFDATIGFSESSMDAGQLADITGRGSTGWISGGEITAASTTEINIAAGFGTIIDYSDPIDPQQFSVPFGPFTNVAITNISTTTETKISINLTASIPTVIQTAVEDSASLNRSSIQLGYVTHAASTIDNTFNIPLAPRETYQQLIDYILCLGVANCGGFELTPNAALTFAKAAGEMSFPGAGVTTDPRENVFPVPADTPAATFNRSLGLTDTTLAPATTLIDPANYDNGTGSPVAIGGGANLSTIQYVFQFPTPSESLVVMYGQTLYANLGDAVTNAANDDVKIPSVIQENSLLIARIAVNRLATDLSDTAQAVFLAGAKFGTGLSGGAGVGGGGGGDFFGPASSTSGNLVSFADTSGKAGADSGVLGTAVVKGASGSVAAEIATYTDTTGTEIKHDSDILALTGGIGRITTDANLTLSGNGTGLIRAENATQSIFDSNSISGVISGVTLSNNGTVGASLTWDPSVIGYTLRNGSAIGGSPAQDEAYITHFGNQRLEIGSNRIEQRALSGNVQYLMQLAGVAKASISWIDSSSSLNIRWGSNPTVSGFDLFETATTSRRPLTVNSTTVKGDASLLAVEGTDGVFYPPRLTTAQRDALASVVAGASIYNTTNSQPESYTGTAWAGTGAGFTPGTINLDQVGFSYEGKNSFAPNNYEIKEETRGLPAAAGINTYGMHLRSDKTDAASNFFMGYDSTYGGNIQIQGMQLYFRNFASGTAAQAPRIMMQSPPTTSATTNAAIWDAANLATHYNGYALSRNTSSEAMKDNIRPIDELVPNATSIVSSITPIVFDSMTSEEKLVDGISSGRLADIEAGADPLPEEKQLVKWIDDPDKKPENRGTRWDVLGFSAENVLSVAPECAVLDADGKPTNISERALLAVAYKSIAELTARIEELEK